MTDKKRSKYRAGQVVWLKLYKRYTVLADRDVDSWDTEYGRLYESEMRPLTAREKGKD